MIQFRKEIGKYVDDKELSRLEQYVFVPINPNSASDETLVTIPGATPQLVRTVKENRPYKTLQEFRAAMTKHGAAKEVARIERYFTMADKPA